MASKIEYAGFKDLDDFEKAKINKIVSFKLKKIERFVKILFIRIHLKPLHEKETEKARQGHIHQVETVLDTNKGYFFAVSKHRNPYHAVSDAMENLLKQVEHKHPHKEEWKEQLKGYRKSKYNKKKT